MRMRHRDGEVTIGELARRVTDLDAESRVQFGELRRLVETNVVPRDVYATESRARDAAIEGLRRSLVRFYGFLGALAVTIAGALISSTAALIIALIVSTRHK